MTDPSPLSTCCPYVWIEQCTGLLKGKKQPKPQEQGETPCCATLLQGRKWFVHVSDHMVIDSTAVLQLSLPNPEKESEHTVLVSDACSRICFSITVRFHLSAQHAFSPLSCGGWQPAVTFTSTWSSPLVCNVREQRGSHKQLTSSHKSSSLFFFHTHVFFLLM